MSSVVVDAFEKIRWDVAKTRMDIGRLIKKYPALFSLTSCQRNLAGTSALQ